MLLTVQDLCKTYPGQALPCLDHVCFHVEQGEFLGIMGASGSGKTTLLNVLATIDQPDSGKILFHGSDISRLSDRQAADFRKNALGFIFQEYLLLDSLTIEENIALPLTLLRQPRSVIKTQVQNLAKRFGIESQLAKYPMQLSGGQRQRASAARALIKMPSLLLADEPTGALDSAASSTLLKALYTANKELKTTILMVTHDPYAASYANRILYVKDGRVQTEIERKGATRRGFYDQIMAETAKQDQMREAV